MWNEGSFMKVALCYYLLPYFAEIREFLPRDLFLELFTRNVAFFATEKYAL